MTYTNAVKVAVKTLDFISETRVQVSAQLVTAIEKGDNIGALTSRLSNLVANEKVAARNLEVLGESGDADYLVGNLISTGTVDSQTQNLISVLLTGVKL